MYLCLNFNLQRDKQFGSQIPVGPLAIVLQVQKKKKTSYLYMTNICVFYPNCQCSETLGGIKKLNIAWMLSALETMVHTF